MGFEVKLKRSKKNRTCELTKKKILAGENYIGVTLIDKLDIKIRGFSYGSNFDYHCYHESVPLEDIYKKLLGKNVAETLVNRVELIENVLGDNVELRKKINDCSVVKKSYVV